MGKEEKNRARGAALLMYSYNKKNANEGSLNKKRSYILTPMFEGL